MDSMIHIVWNKTKAGGIAVAAAAALALAGCGGGSSGTAATGATPVTGKFVDATVVGLGYKCGTSTALSGTTNASGQFTCNTGEEVAFYVGGIKLGSVAAAQAVVTPLDLVGADATPSHPRVINIVRFLMSISSTAAASDTLTLDQAVVDAAVALAIDFTQDAPSNLDLVINAVKPASATVATGPDATAHMSKSIFGLFAGSFSGTFDGSLGGTWNLVINRQGVVTGTATDSDQAEYSVTGNMATTMSTGSTYAFTGTSGGVPWTGSLNMNTREFKGTWSDGAGASGTFAGKAATPAPAPAPVSTPAPTPPPTSSGGGFITSCIANNYSHGVTAAQLSPFVRSYSGNLYASNAPGTPAGAAVNLAIAADGGITYNTVVQRVTSICQDNTNTAQIYVQFLGGGTLSGLDFFTDGGVTGNLADANLTMVQGGSCSTAGGCGTGTGTAGGTTGGGSTPAVVGLMGGVIQSAPLNLSGTVTTSASTYLGQMTTDGAALYIADGTFFRVTSLVTTSNLTTLAGAFTITPGFVDGTGAAAKFSTLGGITSDGTNLYVADIGNHSIRKIVIATGVVTTLAGSGAAGFADGTGTAAQFNQPNGITTDNTNLYVADLLNNRIRKIAIATGVVTTLAGSGAGTRVDGTGVAATFSNPYVIATDGTNLYESDLFGGAIRKIVIATGVVTSYSASGLDVRGITTDGTNLYVLDNNSNKVVRKVVIATGNVSIVAGGGTSVQSTADGIGTAAKFGAPRAITIAGGSLFVADGQDLRRIQ